MKKSGAASLVVVPLLLLVGFILTLLLLLQPPPSGACGAGDELGAGPTTGNLGGVGGTGITAAELATVRSSSLAAGSHFTEGIFRSTAYGPPWGVDAQSGVDQGAGISTAAGLRLNGGAPRKYFVATDPAVISAGQWLYVWPNPFNWRGPFLAADTGGAIDGRHIDIYDWRGRSFQLQWSRSVNVTRAPSSPLGLGPADIPAGGGAPPLTPPATTPAPAATAPAASGPVLNVGDSLGEGSGPELAQKLTGQAVSTLAARNRTSSQGLSILRGVATLPATIVVQLGTNDTDVNTFRANVRSVVALARAASATVWWVNISRPILGGTSASDLNDVLADEAARHGNLKIIDWNAAVANGTVQLADGVHPSAAGYKTRAGLIADALGGAAAGAGDCGGSAAPGSLGTLTGTPESIVNGVVAYAHDHGFPNITAETVRVANAAHPVLTSAGNVSDHKGPPEAAWAADISNGPSPTTEMDALARTIADAFSIPWQGSGLINKTADGYRMQLIYRAPDHFDHVHFGVKKL